MAGGIQHKAEGQVVAELRAVEGRMHLVRDRQEGRGTALSCKGTSHSSPSTLPSARPDALYGHLLSHTDILEVDMIPSTGEKAPIKGQSLVHMGALF